MLYMGLPCTMCVPHLPRLYRYIRYVVYVPHRSFLPRSARFTAAKQGAWRGCCCLALYTQISPLRKRVIRVHVPFLSRGSHTICMWTKRVGYTSHTCGMGSYNNVSAPYKICDTSSHTNCMKKRPFIRVPFLTSSLS